MRIDIYLRQTAAHSFTGLTETCASTASVLTNFSMGRVKEIVQHLHLLHSLPSSVTVNTLVFKLHFVVNVKVIS